MKGVVLQRLTETSRDAVFSGQTLTELIASSDDPEGHWAMRGLAIAKGAGS